jgi:hypothetical protein
MINVPIPSSYWVEPGRLLAGEHPAGFDTEKTRRRLDAFLETGINTFIDLTHAHEQIPYETILGEQAKACNLHATYTRLPIQDFGLPSIETMQEILDAMDHALAKGRKVYVHCWAGVGRTGTTIGCYLVRRGYDGRQAIDQIMELRSGLGSHRSPETYEQMQFILDWHKFDRPAQKGYCEG